MTDTSNRRAVDKSEKLLSSKVNKFDMHAIHMIRERDNKPVLQGSVVEHRLGKCKGLGFEPSWGTLMYHTHTQLMNNIFL